MTGKGGEKNSVPEDLFKSQIATYHRGQCRQPSSGLVWERSVPPLAQRPPASEFCMQGDIAELGEGAMAKADVVTTSRRCYQSPLEVLKGVRFENHK